MPPTTAELSKLELFEGCTATVTATTDMVLEELDGAGFVAALLDVPHVAVALLRQFATRLRATNRLPMLPTPRPQPPAPPRLALVDVAQPRQLDPDADGFFANPYRQLTALREQAPVHWSDAVNSWVVTRYADVHALSRSGLGGLPAPPDGQKHDPPRRRGPPAAAPSGVEGLHPEGAEPVAGPGRFLVEQLLAEAAEKDTIDVMSDFALPLPAQIITEMLGMPAAESLQLRDWSRTLALGSANRDPRKWGPTADVLDVARPGANDHMALGGGAHYCLGNQLARLEARAALPKLVRRFPRMQPAAAEPAWTHRITLRGVDSLPVVLR